MTLDEFRVEMASYRRSADDDAKSLKDPYVTLEKLRGLYEKFDDGERRMADQVLIEWALSEDEELRFHGLALIDELKIATAVAALYELATRLASSTSPASSAATTSDVSKPNEAPTTYNMNIWGLYATEDAQGLGALANAFKAEAGAAGATDISISGNAIINPGIANMNPAIAARYGFSFSQVNATTIMLQGSVP